MDQFADAAQRLEDDVSRLGDEAITVELEETSAGGEYWVRSISRDVLDRVEQIISEPQRGIIIMLDEPSERRPGMTDLLIVFRNPPAGDSQDDILSSSDLQKDDIVTFKGQKWRVGLVRDRGVVLEFPHQGYVATTQYVKSENLSSIKKEV